MEWRKRMIAGIEEKYRSILNNIEELYYEVDLAGNLTFFNDSMSCILGYSREELMGMNNRQYMSAGTANRVYQSFNQVYQTGIPTKAFDWELIRKDGTIRVLETSVSLMRDPKGQPVGFFGIGRDITERKQAEEQEKNLQRAKDKVLNHLSHELRTPLAVIQGNIRLLKRRLQSQPSPIVKEEVFEIMERNLTRISNIQHETNQIILSYQELEGTSSPETIGSKEPLFVETIPLYPFTEQILSKVKQNAAHRDLRIQLDGTNNLNLNMDSGVLGDILIGLLRNSIENTPDGGLVRVVLEQKSQWIQLKVQDFGMGITKENQRHLFDGLFHTLDTELYASKKPYDFGAGGKGLDLFKMKVYSRRFGFDISFGSQRCPCLPKERDLCPGKIALCKYCKKPEDCLSSGGSTFCLSFHLTPFLES
jgi:PAS domain S-box-containing protein